MVLVYGFTTSTNVLVLSCILPSGNSLEFFSHNLEVNIFNTFRNAFVMKILEEFFFHPHLTPIYIKNSSMIDLSIFFILLMFHNRSVFTTKNSQSGIPSSCQRTPLSLKHKMMSSFGFVRLAFQLAHIIFIYMYSIAYDHFRVRHLL